MSLRVLRERVIQVVAYELCALCLAIPFYAFTADQAAGPAIIVMLAMMCAEMLWAPLHDFSFDFVDLRLSGRVASDRPMRWRVIHALSREGTTMVVTLPVLMVMGGHSLREGFMLDLGLTLLYACYAFFFYIGFDHLRPVAPQVAVSGSNL